jgi:hypothetical protein
MATVLQRRGGVFLVATQNRSRWRGMENIYVCGRGSLSVFFSFQSKPSIVDANGDAEVHLAFTAAEVIRIWLSFEAERGLAWLLA